MSATIETAQRARHRGHARVPAGTPGTGWQPASMDEALETMDRISRYCVFTCEPTAVECTEGACEAWNLERAAATYVADRWLDGDD